MNAANETGFDKVAAIFADYGTSLRGYVRYRVIQHNVGLHLHRDKPLQVLDVGGGSGADAAWLAGQGHHVTLVEPSKEQRDYAQRRFNFFLESSERARISIVPGTIDECQTSQKFDLVLVHGVAMFQERPSEFISRAAEHARPGGLISVVEKGYYGAEARAVREQDFDNLKLLHDSGRMVNHLNQQVQTFRPSELTDTLQAAGTDILEWSGVRLVSDDLFVDISTMSKTEVEAVLTVEISLSKIESVRGLAQLLHVVARKR